MKQEFKVIAAGLGIAIPACMLNLGEAKACTQTLLAPNKVVLKNDVSKRIIDFMSNVTDEYDNQMFAHTNSHTDQGGNHTDYHNNLGHSNTHTNKNYPNQCPGHSDVHSDRDGYNSHTDRGRSSHTDYHSNRADGC